MIRVSDFVLNRLTSAPSEYKRHTRRFKRWIFYRMRSLLDSFLSGKSGYRLIVVPGLRGVGKSTMLWQLYEYLMGRLDPTNVLHLPVDIMKAYTGNDSIVEAYEAFLSHSGRGRKVMLIDEVTYSGNWPLELKALYDKDPDTAFIVTGSSSLHLRVAENADLARRAVVELMFPLSFGEYLMIRGSLRWTRFAGDLARAIYELNPEEALEELRKVESRIIGASRGFDPRRDLEEYLRIGGFAFSALSRDKWLAWNQVYESVQRALERDLTGVRGFDDETVFKAGMLVNSLALSQGAATSLNRLADEAKMDKKTLLKVMDALEKCELLFAVRPRSEVAYRRGVSNKYYFATPTIRVALRRVAGYQEDNLGLLAEEAVASSLRKATFLRRGGFSGLRYLMEDGEVDFLLEGSRGEMMIEVGWGRKRGGAISRASGKRLVVHGGDLKVEGGMLYVPLWLFLMI